MKYSPQRRTELVAEIGECRVRKLEAALRQVRRGTRDMTERAPLGMRDRGSKNLRRRGSLGALPNQGKALGHLK